ncbi:flagellar hook-length control protein FliK [Pelomonas sp. KK5]|uniref:flagellar hook-length control protein FliK n=1 Tax=Pelomonas sp. KK5 TaxID=1855730 RepID=UPI00097BF94E|nr:flagellar hook-length control protein FliK [Pelomonas sp. KK5]
MITTTKLQQADAAPVAAAQPGVQVSVQPGAQDAAGQPRFPAQLLVAQPQPELPLPQEAAEPALPTTAAPEAQDLPQALALALQQLQALMPAAAKPDEEREKTDAAVLPATPAPLPQLAAVPQLPEAAAQPLPTAAPEVAAPAAVRTAPAAQDLTPVTTVKAAEADTPDLAAFAPGLAAALSSPQDVKSATTVHLPQGEPQQWQSPLLQALGDRIQLQLAARSETATIRLEPPQMGRVDIAIRQLDGGALQVQLSATHGEVRHQLQQISEGMRWNLVQQRQGGEVSVQVASEASSSASGSRGDGSRSSSQGQAEQHQQRRPGRAWDTTTDAADTPFALS